jgi:hypothetical protein
MVALDMLLVLVLLTMLVAVVVVLHKLETQMEYQQEVTELHPL